MASSTGHRLKTTTVSVRRANLGPDIGSWWSNEYGQNGADPN